MVLTERQRRDLHVAMAEYLGSLGADYTDITAAFRKAAKIEDAAQPSGARKGLLEKKWTTVVRLQKKVMDLEARVKQLADDLRAANKGGAGARKPGKGNDGLPRAPPKHVLKGHRYPITCVALHPVYTLAASASEDATIKIWDYESGEFEETLKGHTNAVQWVAFNAAGKLLASCSNDLSIKLWDMSGGSGSGYSCIRTLRGHSHSVSGVAFVPAPKGGVETLASCSRDNTVRVWDLSSGYCTKTLSGHTDWVRRVVSSNDGSLLASCSSDQTVMVWNADSGAQVASLVGHEHVVESVAFCSKDGATALAKAFKHAAAVEKARAAGKSTASPVAVAAGAGGGGGASQSAANGGAGGGAGVGASTTPGTPTVNYVVSGSRDKTVRVWELGTASCVAQFNDHNSWVRCVCFHANGLYVSSVSEDKSLRVWEIVSNRCARKILDAHEHFVTALDVHATQPVIISAGVDCTLRVWECR